MDHISVKISVGEKPKTGPAAKIGPDKFWLGQIFPKFGWVKIWLGHLWLGQFFQHYGLVTFWLGQSLAADPILAGPILLDRHYGWAIDWRSNIFFCFSWAIIGHAKNWPCHNWPYFFKFWLGQKWLWLAQPNGLFANTSKNSWLKILRVRDFVRILIRNIFWV